MVPHSGMIIRSAISAWHLNLKDCLVYQNARTSQLLKWGFGVKEAGLGSLFGEETFSCGKRIC